MVPPWNVIGSILNINWHAVKTAYERSYISQRPETLNPEQNTLNPWHTVNPAYERSYNSEKPITP